MCCCYLLVGIAWSDQQQKYLADNFSLNECRIQLRFLLDATSNEFFDRKDDLNNTALDETVAGYDLDESTYEKEKTVDETEDDIDIEIELSNYAEILVFSRGTNNFQKKILSMKFDDCDHNWYASVANPKVKSIVDIVHNIL